MLTLKNAFNFCHVSLCMLLKKKEKYNVNMKDQNLSKTEHEAVD